MAIAQRELEQIIIENLPTEVIEAEFIEAELVEPEAAPLPVARYNRDETIQGHGLRGWWRAVHIIGTFALYHVFVFAYHRGWFAGKKEEADQKHLQWQAEWLARQFLKLGPTFIKIGQAVSTRADLLPLAYIKEFSKLQDNVPAFPNEQAMEIIERELGQPIAALYADIETEPIAAASLGQVYRGHLHNGALVAIKVQRPELSQTINFDLAVLRRIARFMMNHDSLSRGMDWEGILDEFATVVFEEMDYVAEARNAESFRDNFKAWREVHVPVMYWSHISPRVITMEFIEGTKINDVADLDARGINRVEVVRLVARTYLKQLLEDGFFHADPHPGNIRVLPSGHLAFFDFGMVGRITTEMQERLIDAFFHIVERDIAGMSQDLINLRFLPADIDPLTIRPVIEKLFKDYFNLKLGEVRFKDLTYEMAEVIYLYPFRIPANFTYVIKAIMTLEGVGITLDPNFNFFDVAKPFAKEFMLKRESKFFREQILRKLIYGEETQIQWGKMWKLTKIAAKMWWEDFTGKTPPPPSLLNGR